MMGALIRALTNNAVENIEEALGMTDATSSAMKHAIAEWYAAWYGRAPTKTEDPCQRLPYAIVNKLCKATFGEYDSGLQHADEVPGFSVPVHRALTEQILLGGAPRSIAIMNGTLAGAVGLGLRLWLVGLAIWAIGHFAAVWAAKRDPLFVEVGRRHLRIPGHLTV